MTRAVKRRRGQKRGFVKPLALTVAVALLITGLVLLLRDRKEAEEESYPVAYEDLIRQYADANAIPASYVAAVIMAESSYQADAVSSVNAMGLMQITQETGEWIASKLDETYADGVLFDPETNIRYGCWFLGFLMKRYNGDMATASSAYHNGYHCVDNWLEESDNSDDGITLKNIPSDLVKTYVTRILKYEAYYQTVFI